MDFGDLKDVVVTKVAEQLDHSFLNESIENPTAENVAVYVFDRLASVGLTPTRLRLWETPSAYVTIEDDD